MMPDIFRHFVDTLFPTHNAIHLLETQTIETFSIHYLPIQRRDFDAVAEYKNPYVKAAITANKFHDYLPAASLLGGLLNKYLTDQHERSTICIPIPLSSSRARTRGYNQVERILAHTPTAIVAPILVRTRDTTPQTSLHRTERLANMQGAFAVRRGVTPLTNTRILIIDDVVTTGATFRAAREAVLPYCGKNSEIICVACAH